MTESGNAILFSSEDYDTVIRVKDICNQTSINLLIETDFFTLFTQIEKLKPKFVFIDERVRKLKTFPLEILDNPIFKKATQLVILSNNFICKEDFIDVVEIKNLKNYILNNNVYYLKPSNNNIIVDDSFINKFLIKLNLCSSLKGKNYLIDCVSLILEDNISYNYLNSECYPVLAHNYNTGIINIDRNIRTAIQKAFKKRNVKYWEECFNQKFIKAPTTKDFIYMCVDKIKELYNK